MTSTTSQTRITQDDTTEDITKKLGAAGQAAAADLRKPGLIPIAIERLLDRVGTENALLTNSIRTLSADLDVSRKPPPTAVFRACGAHGAQIPCTVTRTGDDLVPHESYDATQAANQKKNVGTKTIFVATLPSTWSQTSLGRLGRSSGLEAPSSRLPTWS